MNSYSGFNNQSEKMGRNWIKWNYFVLYSTLWRYSQANLNQEVIKHRGKKKKQTKVIAVIAQC